MIISSNISTSSLLLVIVIAAHTTRAFLVPTPTFHSSLKTKTTSVVFATKNDEDNQDEGVKFNLNIDLTESEYTQVYTSSNVPCAPKLRDAYDDIFNDPRDPNALRFNWDPWYVTCKEGKNGMEAPLPGDEGWMEEDGRGGGEGVVEGEREGAGVQTQYSLKRAQCQTIFSSNNDDDEEEDDSVFASLVEDMTELGRSVGCTAITPPWISMYTEGDTQNFHTDAPHGPLAWVLSLSLDEDYNTKFYGGETMMLQPRMLEYWKGFNADVGLEAPSIVRYIPPVFGRCLAFDPRVPHGVNMVHGSRDPRHGRIVIHGWFADPQTIWCGSFEEEDEARVDGDAILEEALGPLIDLLGGGGIGRVVGYLCVRLEIASDGEVEEANVTCDTLVADPEDYRGVVGEDAEGREVFEDAPSDLKLTVREALMGLFFPETSQGGSVLIPFEFL